MSESVQQVMVETFVSIANGATDKGKRLVSGYMDSGEPNNQGFLLDYDTSLPYIRKYIAAFEGRTSGVSKGAVRVMHQPTPVGKIVEFGFDNAAKALPITVKVDDDDAWDKVEASVYTGFSGHWNVVGQKWLDDDMTAKHGRPIYRFTGDPVEVSLVDVPRVPGCEFQSIENANIPGGDMPEETPATAPITEPTPAPAETPAPAPEAPAEAPVENGIYTARQILSTIEDLGWMQKATEAEETQEGAGSAAPAKLKAAISELAKAALEYTTEQVAEFIEGEDEDALIEELDEIEGGDVENGETGEVENGDYPGHPFHGNQHKKGKKGATQAQHASKRAAGASAAAKGAHKYTTNTSAHHKSAAMAHTEAAKAHSKAGNKKLAAYHTAKAASHNTHAEAVKSGDTDPVQNGDNGDAFALILARLDALEAKSIANGAPAPVPAPVAPVPAAPAPVALFHDAEQGASVRNGDTGPRPMESLAEYRSRIESVSA